MRNRHSPCEFSVEGGDEITKTNIPKQKNQMGGPIREDLSQRSSTTHAKRSSCINSGWGRTGVNSKNCFSVCSVISVEKTPLDRTCIKHTEKTTTKRTNSKHIRVSLADWPHPPTQLFHLIYQFLCFFSGCTFLFRLVFVQQGFSFSEIFTPFLIH